VEIIQQAIQESRGRSPSKRRRDRERFENFEAQRRERLELFGYVKTKNGITLTIEKASAFLAKGELRAEDIAEWFNPSSFRDVVNSLGEVDAIRDYPALGITKGTVLLDPKIRVPGGHTDPALKRT
jgi:CRISPR/Cas system-associated endonuclease Cas3-HD